MKCVTCRREFSQEKEHVEFGGLVWCSDHCLAVFTVEEGLDVDKVAEEREVRNASLP